MYAIFWSTMVFQWIWTRPRFEPMSLLSFPLIGLPFSNFQLMPSKVAILSVFPQGQSLNHPVLALQGCRVADRVHHSSGRVLNCNSEMGGGSLWGIELLVDEVLGN